MLSAGVVIALTTAFAAGVAKRGILAEQAEDMQATADQLVECHPVMLGNGGEANVELVFVILGADVDRRTSFR